MNTQRILSLLALAPAIAGFAQTQPTATVNAPPPLTALEQTFQDIKKPLPWLTWGADMRVRDEYFDNILTLNPDDRLHLQNYMRFRGRIWASITPFEDLSFNARLADEVREWLRPAGYTPVKGTSGLDWRDGIFDNLNVQWRNIFKLPLSATVGRQDFLPGTPSGLGDGWLIGDGTPQDGSWTYFLDAARVKYELPAQHTSIEAIGIIQDAKDDAWLPTINNQDLYETENNEKGAIVWVANKSVPVANVDGYFFYKEDNAISPYNPQNRVAGVTENANIYTVGGRVSGLVGAHWKYSAEGAYQFGRKDDPAIDNRLLAPAARTTGYRDISSFGVNTKMTYLFKDSLNNQLNFSYEFLSGDDPNTKNDEMFDNLWGRWPRWSEIGLYSFANETKAIGQEANLHRFGPGWGFTPMKNMDFSAAYYALFAQQEIATRGVPGLFAGNANKPDHGLFRGHFLQAVLKYKFSKHLSGHLWAEFEFPGDYYVSHATWYFLRPEITLTF